VREVRTADAPAPVGPYSQAVSSDGLLFVSGQIPLDPATGERVGGEIEDEVEQVIANLRAVLEAGGSGIEQVIRTTVFVTDLALFARINAVYARHFTGDPAPARATVQVAALPLGARVEIDAIAVLRTPHHPPG
jgi:reactive intermediate/imine deaminase